MAPSAPQSPEKDTASSTDEPANPPVPSVQVDGPDDDTSEQPRRAVHVAFTSDTDGDKSKENLNEGKISDVFDLTESPAPDDTTEIEITRTSIELDVLPIELISLTDSFIDSLAAKKIYKTPPSIDRLSELFQTFYAQASSNINTHLSASALSTRRSRDPSPTSSISSATGRFRSKPSNLSSSSSISELPSKPDHEQQMITTEELADRKQARKARDAKQHLLEEAVERRVCEGIYERIYRHKSTQDEAQDEKLRSKTAALALVGIGPADLGVELGDGAEISPEATTTETSEIKERLASARNDLIHMSESRYPLGKLNHLKAAHRSIVDTIAHFHPSASADEIMPMLIFTLITLPPENLHVISDINFIQYFRWEPKLTGEAAYCLTNLEAAISFLQTVDLATLRSDELPSGPPKVARSPRSETFPPAYIQGSTPVEPETTKATAGPFRTPAWASAAKAAPVPPKNRRLSELVPTPAQAFGAASDAVFNTADQGLKTVTNSLGDSYKFFLSKIRESQDGAQETIAVPRTLDDARKLVSTPPPDEEGGSTCDDTEQPPKRPSPEDRVQSILNKKRDNSTDSIVSARSTNSTSKLMGFFSDAPAPSPTPPPAQTPPVLNGMRSLSHTFVPVARFSSQIDGMLRSFGRNSIAVPPSRSSDANKPPADGGDLATAFPDIAAALPPKQEPTKEDPPKQEPPKIAPPNKKFMELQNPGDLKLNEVLELLRDYRRLAGSLEKMGAFEERPS